MRALAVLDFLVGETRTRRDWAAGLARRPARLGRGKRRAWRHDLALSIQSLARLIHTDHDCTVSGPAAGCHSVCGWGLEGMCGGGGGGLAQVGERERERLTLNREYRRSPAANTQSRRWTTMRNWRKRASRRCSRPGGSRRHIPTTSST